MSPHGRFSIRKFLTTARRRSAVAGDGMGAVGMHAYGDENDEDDPVYIKRSASASAVASAKGSGSRSASGSSASIRSAPKATPAGSRAGSRGAAAAADAEEVERVKAAVATAAAHAATSLRFRLDGDDDGIESGNSEPGRRIVHFDRSRVGRGKMWPMMADDETSRDDAKATSRLQQQPQPSNTGPLTLHEQWAQQPCQQPQLLVDAENSQDRLCSANSLSTNTTTTISLTTFAAPNPAANDQKQARQSSQSSQSSSSCQSWQPTSSLSSPASSLIVPSPPPPALPQPERIAQAGFEPSSPTPTTFSTTTDDGSLSWPSTPLQNTPPSLYNAGSPPARASPPAPIPDEKKDSGVSLDQVDESELQEKEKESKRQLRKRDSLFGFSQGPTLNLLEALSIEPEEAISLRQECQQQYQPHHFRRTAAMNANLHVSPAVEPEPSDDECMSPTFTRPRPAPLPMGRRSLVGSTPLTPPYTPLTAIPTFRTPEAAKAGLGQPAKKFSPLRIRPAGLARKPSVAVSRPAQRKRSTKNARRRDRPAAGRASGANTSRPAPQASKPAEPAQPASKASSRDASHHHHHHRSSSSGGGSRWGIPDNMAELFNGLLFGRMEVTEMLPPEKLKAIRESRAVAAVAAAAAAAAEKEEKRKEEKRAKEEAKEQRSLVVLQAKETEAEKTSQPALLPEIRVGNLQMDMEEGKPRPEDGDGEMTPKPPQRLPPPIPLPFATEDPEGCQTPEEPFHLQDLPSRIGAAGVRLSVLQPMEEEAKAFDNSLALKRKRDEERERKQAEEDKAREEKEAKEKEEAGKKKQPHVVPTTMPTIPELTVTEAGSQTGRPAVVPSLPSRMGAIRSGTIRSTVHVVPVVPMVTVVTVDAEYIRLPATPYSLMTPMFRHGPVRLAKPDPEAMLSRSRRQMMAADDTLDWTAFQMAILGGAGDFFSDSVDYGRASADADELDDLVCWFCSLELPQEQLLHTKEEEILVKGVKGQEAPPAAQAPIPPPPPPSSLPPARTIEPPTIQAPLPPPPPPQADSLYPSAFSTVRPRRDSTASYDSYDSMPQSPLADVVMSRAADGTEYAVPMGYNLGHDLGEFLRWETENVSRMEV